jgi:hypothetical protein
MNLLHKDAQLNYTLENIFQKIFFLPPPLKKTENLYSILKGRKILLFKFQNYCKN